MTRTHRDVVDLDLDDLLAAGGHQNLSGALRCGVDHGAENGAASNARPDPLKRKPIGSEECMQRRLESIQWCVSNATQNYLSEGALRDVSWREMGVIKHEPHAASIFTP